VSNEVQSGHSQLESADSQFKTGSFAGAEKTYREVVERAPKNFRANLRLGYIALLANRLDDAHKWLAQAIQLKPREIEPRALLAEVWHRKDKFELAAPLLQSIGRKASAKKLESFKNVSPYQIEGEAENTSLKFVMTDPLPVVQVRVNGSKAVNFFIDTGGADMIVDTDFAKEIGAAQFGSETGVFAGGRKSGFQQGRVDSISLSDFVVKNVPVALMDVRRFSQPIFGEKRVDGIIGTVLFYHFFATMDYPGGELVLRRKSKEGLQHFEQDTKGEKHITVPFWMAGDHYMVAWGTINKSRPMLLFVDTGLAGGGFTCPESTLKESGIQLQKSLARQGIGGGGQVTVVPFVVDELSLGDAKEHDINGLYSGAFPLENAFGFHIGGIISHGFFRPYALSLDFIGMRYFLKRGE